MDRFLARMVAALITAGLLLSACGGSSEPDRADLERIYGRLVELGAPGYEPDEESLAGLQRSIDSLGGIARVESLLTASIAGEPELWREALDSISTVAP